MNTLLYFQQQGQQPRAAAPGPAQGGDAGPTVHGAAGGAVKAADVIDTIIYELRQKYNDLSTKELAETIETIRKNNGSTFRGLTINQIIKMASEIIENSCSICFEGMTEGFNKHPLKKLACHHEFHKHCIDEWFKTNRQCPLCRQHEVDKDMFPALGGDKRRAK